MRLFLIKQGGLGVQCVDGDEVTAHDFSFSSAHGLERLLGALPLQPGDGVAICRARDGDRAWQDELESLVLRNHPGVVPITHELAPIADPPGARPASAMDVHCLVEFTRPDGPDEAEPHVICEPLIPRGSGACSAKLHFPPGRVRLLRLFVPRPGGPPWLLDHATGCAFPGQKELARTTLCLMHIDRLVSAEDPLDGDVELTPDGELRVELPREGGTMDRRVMLIGR